MKTIAAQNERPVRGAGYMKFHRTVCTLAGLTVLFLQAGWTRAAEIKARAASQKLGASAGSHKRTDAREIKIWTARAIATVLTEVGLRFERETGHKFFVSTVTWGKIAVA